MTVSRRHFLAAMAGLAILPASARSATHSDAPFALAGTVFTGEDKPPLHDHAVVVHGTRIVDVVPIHSANIPRTITVPNAFIMPGVINCHVHGLHSPKERRERWLQHGVTAIGDVGSPLKAISALTQTPTGQTATAACSGPILCPPGGYPLPVHDNRYGLVVTSPQHGREQVRRLADLGATMIKLAFEPGPNRKPWPMLDAATAKALCNQARSLGLVIRCHVEDIGGLGKALNAGVDTIEHVPHRWLRNGVPHPILDRQGLPISPYRKLLDRMVKNGIILTPTQDVLSRSMWSGPELSAPVQYFNQLNGDIAVGNDFPYRRTEAGMPSKECTLLQSGGLSNHRILQGATRVAARACGFKDRGTIRAGNSADLLLFSGSPLSDLAQLTSPELIIKDGQRIIPA
ncbi:Imidazolonepropionase [Pseudodesulfovibrio profundus]|uniref:Imidazolonepropionase n=1 Tax=Pseudodesulfovibrio profundus TaxID=57320 RepID=A0A2C8F8T4_9BACT|nr:amidohydrolase family protein [Pseudodesulfovibrio profundus]SOB59040.1 Imidazolonepropionase [Pseudodesulfovibrio profundus]